MHDDEVEVDDALVHRLVAAQLPDLADLPLVRIGAWGTDHAIFRLGDELSVRVPKIGWAAEQGPRQLRGRAWAASAALQALPYYRETNPDIMTRSWRAVRAVLEDLEQG